MSVGLNSKVCYLLIDLRLCSMAHIFLLTQTEMFYRFYNTLHNTPLANDYHGITANGPTVVLAYIKLRI